MKKNDSPDVPATNTGTLFDLALYGATQPAADVVQAAESDLPEKKADLTRVESVPTRESVARPSDFSSEPPARPRQKKKRRGAPKRKSSARYRAERDASQNLVRTETSVRTQDARWVTEAVQAGRYENRREAFIAVVSAGVGALSRTNSDHKSHT